MEEKRRFPRLKVQFPLRYQIRGFPQAYYSQSGDLSLGGLSFSSERYIPPKTFLMLEMSILSRLLTACAKVIWANPQPHSDRYWLGVEFQEIAPQEKNFLQDYLDLRLEKV